MIGQINMLVLPISNDPQQQFIVNGFTFFIKWINYDQAWRLTISQNNIVLIAGVKLVLGIFLLQIYNLGIGDVVVVNNSGQSQDPNLNDMGTVWSLIYLTEQEVEGLQ